MMRATFSLAALALLAAISSGRADEPTVSPAHARAAREAGLIKPLAALLGVVEAHYTGDVIEAELHETNGQWSYEFELLPANGRIYQVHVDATTGKVIHTHGPVQEKH
jgi:uncharacterized membrane protein YkoI